jgi:hypothetical protein
VVRPYEKEKRQKKNRSYRKGRGADRKKHRTNRLHRQTTTHSERKTAVKDEKATQIPFAMLQKKSELRPWVQVEACNIAKKSHKKQYRKAFRKGTEKTQNVDNVAI